MNLNKIQKQYEGDSRYYYMLEDHYMNYGSLQKHQMKVILLDHKRSRWLFIPWEKKDCRIFMRT